MTHPQSILDRAAEIHERIIADGPESAIHHIAEALKAERAGQWQSIETAPRDGASILVSGEGHVDQAEYEFEEYRQDEGWWNATGGKRDSGNWLGYEPTSWCPLPSPPTDKQ